MKITRLLILTSLAAILIAPAAAIDLNSSTSIRYFPDSGEKEFAVTPEGNLNMTGDNITNFFDQTKCGSDEAIKTVYPNGSYECNTISQTTSTENLSETLAAGNVANQSINMSGSNMDEVRVLNSGGNQVSFGGVVDFQDKDVGNVSVLNPDGGNLVLNSNLTVGNSGTLARVNELKDLPLNPVVDDWDDGDASEYEIGGSGITSTVSSSDGINDSAGTKIDHTGSGFVEMFSVFYRNSSIQRGDSFKGYANYTHHVDSASIGELSIGFGLQSASDVDDINGYMGHGSGYAFVLDYPDNDLEIYEAGTKQASVSTSTGIVEGEPYRWEIDWMQNGTIRGSLYNYSTDNKLGSVTYEDNTYNKGIYTVSGPYVLADGTESFEVDDFKITESDGIEIDAPVDLQENSISGVNRINAFFDQSKCDSDEAIKTVYPNGSYACNKLSSTTQAENLSETLSAGNSAGDNNINLSGNNLTNVDTVKGSSPVSFADNINLSDNNITDVGNINFSNAGGDILNVDRLSLSQGSSDFRLRVGGQKFLDDGFEDGDLAPFRNGTGPDWTISSTTDYGSFSAETQVSPSTSGVDPSNLKVDVNGGTALVFKYRFARGAETPDITSDVTSGSNTVFLEATGQDWATASIGLDEGTKTITWTLDDDRSIGFGDSRLLIDDVLVANTTEDAVSVLGSMTLNSGSISDVNRISFVNGTSLGAGTVAERDGVAIGRRAESSSTGVSVGAQARAPSSSIAVGKNSEAQDSGSIAIGPETFEPAAIADGVDSIAIGTGAEVRPSDSIALGPRSRVDGGDDNDASSSVAIGDSASASDFKTVALGKSAKAKKEGAIAIGNSAGQSGGQGINSIVIGRDPGGVGSPGGIAKGENSIALGTNATATKTGSIAIGKNSVSNQTYEATFGNLNGEELDVNVTGNLTVHQRTALGDNSLNGLSSGDLNASTVYYDETVAKSPVVQCSQGSDWCSVSVPENQSSFFVKKGEEFDKDRPRSTAEEVVESDVETIERFEELRKENQRQEERIEELNSTVQSLKSVLCKDNPEAEVCQ